MPKCVFNINKKRSENGIPEKPGLGPGITKLCINLFINLFHGEYTEAAITMCYKFQKIMSSYLNFSEILEKKNCEKVPFFLVKLKILRLQLHKCTHF